MNRYKYEKINLMRPEWLKKKINWQDTKNIHTLLKRFSINTVCEEAHCPNISECFYKGWITFMIMGDVCTRNCKFCAVKKGTPKYIDKDEPLRIAKAVQSLRLKYVVVTSVTRDDLPDYGAEHFAQTIIEIRNINKVKIEILTPDFRGRKDYIRRVTEATPDVFNHNLETVPRLYPLVRPDASYTRSINLLRMVKEVDHSIYTKSGLMLGLGETEDEVVEVMHDLGKINCDILTLGQYLQPSFGHYSVKEYLTPLEFDRYKKIAEGLGFLFVASGPYVRSSYMAEEIYLSTMTS